MKKDGKKRSWLAGLLGRWLGNEGDDDREGGQVVMCMRNDCVCHVDNFRCGVRSVLIGTGGECVNYRQCRMAERGDVDLLTYMTVANSLEKEGDGK